MGDFGTYLTALSRTLAAASLCVVTTYATAVRADYADGVYAENHISLETAIHVWRQAAWRSDDFLSEIKLGDIYSNAADSRYYEPVEAYVWYYLAGRNRAGGRGYWDNEASELIGARRDRARARQSELLLGFSSQERADAHDRIVYILSCRGAEGFLKLGRVSTPREVRDTDWDYDFGGRSSDYGGRSYDYGGRDASSRSVMVPSDAEALTYFHIADSRGNPLGRAYLNPIEARLRGDPVGTRIVERQAKSFQYWTPPYEFYPHGSSASGVPLSDECTPTLERQRALILASAIPPPATRHALYFLGWRGPGAIAHYQASIPDEPTGRLTAAQLVRAIQTAAVNGDAASQNTLGVMYAKGLGVVTNYVRAEYWFAKAADQRYPAALYHLGVLYKVGPPGIDQDLHKSNDYMTSSALAGFRPTMNQLGALLSAAANQPPRPGQN